VHTARTRVLAHPGAPALAHPRAVMLAHPRAVMLAHPRALALARLGALTLAHLGALALAHPGALALACPRRLVAELFASATAAYRCSCRSLFCARRAGGDIEQVTVCHLSRLVFKNDL
jgi:hypothetical protein